MICYSYSALYWIAVAFVLWLSTLPASGQQDFQYSSKKQRQTSTLVQKSKSTQQALLWRIEGKGIKCPSYLFGTIHRLCVQDVKLGKSVRRALAATQQIALELDINALASSPNAELLMQASLMRGDTTLEMLIDDEEAMETVRTYAQSVLGLPLLPPLNRIKPMVLAMMLLTTHEDDCEQTSLEEVLVKLAQQQNKPIIGIETVEQQIALFDSVPYRQQAEMLVQDIKATIQPEAANVSNVSLRRIVALYKAGRIAELLDILERTYGMQGRVTELMVDQRNRAWLPTIEKLIGEKATFIAVGAGHLVGEVGLVALLRSRGFHVLPLSTR
ncbi:MAG: TraB/GumN family protein [Bacteroidota bacterium]|nr:TraB/GumN family protein [Candidatus Kapabacteria bacterium]MDW8219633.1 TraB/GumN family protein [Bacteroidota bacterium]